MDKLDRWIEREDSDACDACQGEARDGMDREAMYHTCEIRKNWRVPPFTHWTADDAARPAPVASWQEHYDWNDRETILSGF